MRSLSSSSCEEEARLRAQSAPLFNGEEYERSDDTRVTPALGRPGRLSEQSYLLFLREAGSLSAQSYLLFFRRSGYSALLTPLLFPEE